MGQVAFNNMPSDIRVPLFYAEVNAGVPPYSGISRTILLGRKLTGGSAAIGKAINLGSQDPNGLCGPGSMLADMAAYARWHNPTGAVWILPVADPVGATAATGTIAFSGTATSAGTLVRYVAGERYEIAVGNGDTAAAVATAFAAAVGRGYTKFNRRMLPTVTAGAATGTVTLTARHAGTEGNGIRIESGLDGNEIDPPGITATITAMSGGAGDVDLAAALAALGPMQFDWVASPYNSTTQLGIVRNFFSDAGSGRWSPTVGLDGHYITAYDGNLAAQTTLGGGLNDRHATVLGLNSYPAPVWCWVAALAGLVGFAKNLGAALTEAIEIARPMQTLQLQGLRPPKDIANQWGLADRQALYTSGISALTFGPDGTPTIDRVLTTYQQNAWGVADITFLGIESIATAAYVKRYLKQRITSTYPRCVLRNDNPNGIQGVATPDGIRGTAVAAYTELDQVAGIVENTALFAKYVIVERSSDPNRVNAYLPIDVANQLIVFAGNLTIFPQLNDQIAALQ